MIVSFYFRGNNSRSVSTNQHHAWKSSMFTRTKKRWIFWLGDPLGQDRGGPLWPPFSISRRNFWGKHNGIPGHQLTIIRPCNMALPNEIVTSPSRNLGIDAWRDSQRLYLQQSPEGVPGSIRIKHNPMTLSTGAVKNNPFWCCCFSHQNNSISRQMGRYLIGRLYRTDDSPFVNGQPLP